MEGAQGFYRTVLNHLHEGVYFVDVDRKITFWNNGAEKIFVGVRELQCMGARAPFDHPHVFLDMGQDTQILCPYCSTLFVFDARLHGDESDPKGCLVTTASTIG